MTGAQLLQALGLGVSLLGQTDALLLQVSGLSYRYDMSVADPRQRLIVSSVRVGCEPIDPARAYRVAANAMEVEIAQAMLIRSRSLTPLPATPSTTRSTAGLRRSAS